MNVILVFVFLWMLMVVVASIFRYIDRRKMSVYEVVKEDYPSLFHNNMISFGCGKGWKKLVLKTCKRLLKANPKIKIDQLKEKFGGLRIYLNVYEPETEKIVDEAENESFKICEICGTRRNVTVEGSWVKTFCKRCRARPDWW